MLNQWPRSLPGGARLGTSPCFFTPGGCQGPGERGQDTAGLDGGTVGTKSVDSRLLVWPEIAGVAGRGVRGVCSACDGPWLCPRPRVGAAAELRTPVGARRGPAPIARRPRPSAARPRPSALRPRPPRPARPRPAPCPPSRSAPPPPLPRPFSPLRSAPLRGSRRAGPEPSRAEPS